MALTSTPERPIGEIRLDGGRPCLDFVNSIHDRFAPKLEDYLTTPQRFIAWCERARLLDRSESDRLKVGATAIRDIHKFREQLHAVSTASIVGAAPARAALQGLDLWLHRAWKDRVLDLTAPQCLSWSPRGLDMRLPLKRIALSALDLLSDADIRRRLKRCESQDSCGWLFYDETKNNQRRWCAMDVCGTVAKMRRYRAHH
jgi:predicted RNA-binding Zn ribbon-like protein